MRKIHIYYLIFIINVINLYFKLYYEKIYQVTKFYAINLRKYNDYANKIFKFENKVFDDGQINIIMIIQFLLSFIVGCSYPKHKYFLFFIVIFIETLNFYYLNEMKILIIFGSIIFYLFGSLFKKKNKILNIQEHEIYK